MADGNAVAVQPVRLPTVTEVEHAAFSSIIERAARDPSVDIAKLERLVELQVDAEKRRAKASYLAAIAKMQAELPAVARRGTAHNNKKYARLEDIIEAAKPVLSKHGFSLTYRITQTDKTMTIVGVLGHEDGHTEQTDMTLPADNSGGKNIVQAWGSSATYGKRYVALTLLGIATEDEDDDGKAAGAKPVADNTLAHLNTLIADTGASVEWICNHYSVGELGDLTGPQIAEAIAGLAARKRAKK